MHQLIGFLVFSKGDNMELFLTCKCGKKWRESSMEITEEDIVGCTVLPDGSLNAQELDIFCPDCTYLDEWQITRDWERR